MLPHIDKPFTASWQPRNQIEIAFTLSSLTGFGVFFVRRWLVSRRMDTSSGIIFPTASSRDNYNQFVSRIVLKKTMEYAVATKFTIPAITGGYLSRAICISSRRAFHASSVRLKPILDPRLEDHGHVIHDKYSTIREKYDAPKNPVVLAHGLLGFDELRLAGPYLPSVQYWRGIKEALSAQGIEVITATVPPSSSIEQRAEELAREIEVGARGKDVNIIAHSMGGLDSRYMISRLKQDKFKVLSLTTIATPHRGSAVADFVFDQIGADRLPQIYYTLDRLNVETGAFAQLTRKYMTETFNPHTPDIEDVRYFSYGAAVNPSIWSVFRLSHKILSEAEGPNDGLVSVASSHWGGKNGYKGTLVGVSHLDLINWSNRLKWLVGEVMGQRRNFNAIAFYLDITDMLAKEGL